MVLSLAVAQTAQKDPGVIWLLKNVQKVSTYAWGAFLNNSCCFSVFSARHVTPGLGTSVHRPILALKILRCSLCFKPTEIMEASSCWLFL